MSRGVAHFGQSMHASPDDMLAFGLYVPWPHATRLPSVHQKPGGHSASTSTCTVWFARSSCTPSSRETDAMGSSCCSSVPMASSSSFDRLACVHAVHIRCA